VMVQPFNNTLVQIDLTGAELKAVLEERLGAVPQNGAGLLLPSRGTSYLIDISRPAGDRLVGLKVAGRPVETSTVYRVTVPNFLADGGDAHLLLKNATHDRYDTGVLDIEAFVDFLKANDPVDGRLEGRVEITGAPPTAK